MEIDMGLATPAKVQKLQTVLHVKAKGSPDFRFYALYDKLYRADVLAHAYACCRANGGVAGVDGQTFGHIESYGRNRWLGELTQKLKERAYHPQAVRRVYIPKANGGQRPLGIPTVTDRVVQMAAVIVLEPIFEADLQPEQYAYRPGRSAHDAIRHVHKLVNTGHAEVIDADLSGYFDSVPHSELMQSVRRRISDGSMLHLIKRWLEMPVEEEDRCGRTRRTTRNRDEGKGTPQGAPISPLLSNLYMRRFVLGWKALEHVQRLDAQIVSYADDFVICCRHGRGLQAMAVMRNMMSKLKLTINEQKTQICRLPEDTFDFLGYTIGRCWSPRTGRAYYGTWPSQRAVQKMVRTVTELTDRRCTPMDPRHVVEQINCRLVGWSNYFCLGPVSKAYRAVDRHTRYRLRRWLARKHKLKSRGTSHFPDAYLYEHLALVRLQPRTANLPWANT
jgi:group II intron reverse transcriptase/maturase